LNALIVHLLEVLPELIAAFGAAREERRRFMRGYVFDACYLSSVGLRGLVGAKFGVDVSDRRWCYLPSLSELRVGG
jgi:hypothetical protein